MKNQYVSGICTVALGATLVSGCLARTYDLCRDIVPPPLEHVDGVYRGVPDLQTGNFLLYAGEVALAPCPIEDLSDIPGSFEKCVEQAIEDGTLAKN